MNYKLQTFRNTLEQRKGQRSQIEHTLDTLRVDTRNLTHELTKHEQAKEVIRVVGLKTQQQLQFKISDITSLALDAVFRDPYRLEVEFIQRRNKTECDLFFVRGDQRIDPLSASGGGAVDVAAFALRIASWSMMQPHTRNTIILDEPLRFLSADLQRQASTMIVELSRRLGIQFIIVTHEPVLASYADQIFESTIHDGITKIAQQ